MRTTRSLVFAAMSCVCFCQESSGEGLLQDALFSAGLRPEWHPLDNKIPMLASETLDGSLRSFADFMSANRGTQVFESRLFPAARGKDIRVTWSYASVYSDAYEPDKDEILIRTGPAGIFILLSLDGASGYGVPESVNPGGPTIQNSKRGVMVAVGRRGDAFEVEDKHCFAISEFEARSYGGSGVENDGGFAEAISTGLGYSFAKGGGSGESSDEGGAALAKTESKHAIGAEAIGGDGTVANAKGGRATADSEYGLARATGGRGGPGALLSYTGGEGGVAVARGDRADAFGGRGGDGSLFGGNGGPAFAESLAEKAAKQKGSIAPVAFARGGDGGEGAIVGGSGGCARAEGKLRVEARGGIGKTAFSSGGSGGNAEAVSSEGRAEAFGGEAGDAIGQGGGGQGGDAGVEFFSSAKAQGGTGGDAGGATGTAGRGGNVMGRAIFRTPPGGEPEYVVGEGGVGAWGGADGMIETYVPGIPYCPNVP